MDTKFILFKENGFKRPRETHSSIDQRAFVNLDKANHTEQLLS